MNVAILQMPEIRARVVPLGVPAYECMTARGVMPRGVELLMGILVEKVGKSPLHAQITDRLFKLLFLAIGESAWVRSEAPVVLQDSVPEPDVSVVAGQDSDYSTRHPRGAKLVVEVAVSSESLDREMAAVYAAGGVEEYWLVLAKSRSVECFSMAVDGVYKVVRKVENGRVESVALPGVALDLGKVFMG
jgi:Uma2 family endonuclease